MPHSEKKKKKEKSKRIRGGEGVETRKRRWKETNNEGEESEIGRRAMASGGDAGEAP